MYSMSCPMLVSSLLPTNAESHKRESNGQTTPAGLRSGQHELGKQVDDATTDSIQIRIVANKVVRKILFPTVAVREIHLPTTGSDVLRALYFHRQKESQQRGPSP